MYLHNFRYSILYYEYYINWETCICKPHITKVYLHNFRYSILYYEYYINRETTFMSDCFHNCPAIAIPASF